MWRFIPKFGVILMVLSSGPTPKVTGDNSQAPAMVVLGTWSTFSSLRNMRCICNHAISTITSTFYVNISLTSPALFHGAWIAKHVQSATTNMWHVLKNNYYSYPPEIDLWFDLRYESHDPEPTGFCSWNFSDPSQQTTTTATSNNDGIVTDTQLNVSFPPFSTDRFTSSTTPAYNNDSEEAHTDPPTTKSSTPEVTRPNDIVASCLCPCSCVKKTQEEIDAMIREIIGDLRINENATALARRRLSSASDTRWVSRGIGGVGVIIMTVVFGSIALADYKRFLNSFHMLLKNISGQH